MLIIGHRGARGHAPENTLASVRRAIELGADAVEIDVHLVEGRLVVIHDDHLERTTTGTGSLAATTFAALRALDAGGGERIPTLDEVLDVLEGNAAINVELKGAGTAAPVVETVTRRGEWWRDRVLISSFDHAMLAEVRTLAPSHRLGALVRSRAPRPVEQALSLGAYSLNAPFRIVNAALVRAARSEGLRVLPFTVNEPDDIERMRALGADGLFTDYPDRVARHGPRCGRFPTGGNA